MSAIPHLLRGIFGSRADAHTDVGVTAEAGRQNLSTRSVPLPLKPGHPGGNDKNDADAGSRLVTLVAPRQSLQNLAEFFRRSR